MVQIKILESSENYLETILMIQQKKGSVRAVDIANELSFSKASVSVAMKNLRENGYIFVEQSGNITLLDKGREIAESVFEKHKVISALLTRLGVPPEIATKDACRIEHVLSPETFQALKNHLEHDDK